MRTLRASLRCLALGATTFACYLAFMLGRPFVLGARSLRWRNRWFRAWSRAVARMVGMSIRVDGVPPDHAVLVSNHLSYIDIILIATQVDAVFVAKSEVASWPVIGHLCRAIDTIFVDRSIKRDVVRAGREIEARIDRGLGVVFFPEGTSTDGSVVLPFRSSLLEAAAREAIPVHWVAIRYRVAEGEPPADQSVCWWGTMEFIPHFRHLLGLRSFEATIHFGADAIASIDRKELAERLRSAIAGAAGLPEGSDDERRFAFSAIRSSAELRYRERRARVDRRLRPRGREARIASENRRRHRPVPRNGPGDEERLLLEERSGSRGNRIADDPSDPRRRFENAGLPLNGELSFVPAHQKNPQEGEAPDGAIEPSAP